MTDGQTDRRTDRIILARGKNQNQIPNLLTHAKLGEGWAIFLNAVFNYTLGSNLWYTHGKSPVGELEDLVSGKNKYKGKTERDQHTAGGLITVYCNHAACVSRH